MNRRRCVGIDGSADEIVVAIAGKAERLTLANDLDGHARLVRLLTRGQAGVRVCLEATGIYHLDLALALHRAPRIEVSVLNPASVRDFGRALMERSKTDRVDAGVLLAYAERMPLRRLAAAGAGDPRSARHRPSDGRLDGGANAGA